MSQDIILGIDLGTTFSSVSAWGGNQLHLIRDHRGDPRIPSVVYLPPGRAPVVGHEADVRRATEPHRVVHGIKRVLGRTHDSPEARILGAHSAYRTKPAANGQIIAEIDDQEYPATQIASMIFRHLRELAEKHFSRPINKAVLTVPASATTPTIGATQLAARIAGIETVDVRPEPCAGALAFHIHNYRGVRRVLVYDFGGGTFDVSVLEQHDRQFTVVAVGGDDSLGGDDFDRVMVEWIASKIWERDRVDITNDVVRMDDLLRACERAKRALSLSQAAPLRLPNAYSLNGKGCDLKMMLRRQDMEALWMPLIQRTMKVTVETMVKAGLRPNDIDLVLTVGGTTHTPIVRQMVDKVLGRSTQKGADPQTAVAMGAALIAAHRVRLAA